MTYKVIVSSVANENLNQAIEYYVKNVNKKTALLFLQDYKRVYKALQVNPFYQFHDTNYRFLPFKKFPYIAFFLVNENNKTVHLNAIFHTSQHPNKYPEK